jgi:hypothetical protein
METNAIRILTFVKKILLKRYIIEKRNAATNLTIVERAPNDPKTNTNNNDVIKNILIRLGTLNRNNINGGTINNIFPIASGCANGTRRIKYSGKRVKHKEETLTKFWG